METIDGKEYYTTDEVVELYNVSRWLALEIHSKKIIKDTLRIRLPNHNQVKIFYNKIEVDNLKDHYRNNIYRKEYFLGDLQIIDDTTILFDGEMFKSSLTYQNIHYVNKNGTKIYRKTDEGYLKIKITKRGDGACHPIITAKRGNKQRTIFVHRLQVEAWIGPAPSPEHVVIRHLNDIPGDNVLENLCWGTHSENIGDNTKNHLKYKHFLAYMRLKNNKEYEEFCRYHESFKSQQDIYSDINDMTWQLTMDKDTYDAWTNEHKIKKHPLDR